MRRILIVEDDPVGKVVTQKMLELHFSCEVTDTAIGALKAVDEEFFDVLVLDINLGNDSMDGIELLRQIREKPGYETIKAVATTAYAMEGDKERFLSLGFDAYVSKPIRIAELVSTMEQLFL